MKQYKVGITFGVFDFLHEGHLRLLKRASEKCDLLIVGVSKDAFAAEKKDVRPAMPYSVRKNSVKALPFVHMVCEQSNSFTKRDAVAKFKADVIFVGDDWTPSTFTGEGLGVPVEYLPRTPDVSSTALRKIISEKV